MAGLPPPPLQDPQGSFGWLEWYRQLRDYISTASSIPWNIIHFAGSKLTDLQQRRHNDLQDIQGGISGERYHLSSTEVAAIGGSTFTTALTAPTVKATTAAGYISSDGSTGFTGTVTTASLVGKTITIKDGIITSVA